MYNIVRHLVEGREGIETYLKLKHLNSFANIESEYIYLPSVSVCERVSVCVCACCSHSFGFGFGYFCSRCRLVVIRFVFVGSLILFPVSSSLLDPFPTRGFFFCFHQYYFISLLQVLCTPVFYFFFGCFFFLCVCIICCFILRNFCQ